MGEESINNSIRFYNGSNGAPRNEVLRISKEGVWANPDVPADEAAQLVLKAIDGYVKGMVLQAVKAEREACAKVCEYVGSGSGFDCARLIRHRERGDE